MEKYPKNTCFEYLDVTNKEKAMKLVKEHDIVISLIINTLHPYVIEYCIQCRKSMVCSSYLQEQYKEFDEWIKKAGISIVFEVGLDPGIDHIVTMEMIDQVRKK